MFVGFGYDVHRLVTGRPLYLGGVAVPFEKGLLGHSDADVLLHAICDALLGAAGLGDIGMHFPDTDPQYRGVSSLKLLQATRQMIVARGFAVRNVDATLIAEAPKISHYREAMRQNVARSIAIDPNRINIKATTTEGLGFIGNGEGMAAMCTAVLYRTEPAETDIPTSP